MNLRDLSTYSKAIRNHPEDGTLLVRLPSAEGAILWVWHQVNHMLDNRVDSKVVKVELFNSIARAELELTECGSITVDFEEKVEVSPPQEFEDRISGEEVGIWLLLLDPVMIGQ